MLSPFRFAPCCLALATTAAAGEYPPPPGPYVNPAVEQWLAARTRPLLEAAGLERTEAPGSRAADAGPEEPGPEILQISTQKTVAGASWSRPDPAPAGIDLGASGSAAETGSALWNRGSGNVWPVAQAGTWRETEANPTVVYPEQVGPVLRKGLLNPRILNRLPPKSPLAEPAAADYGPNLTSAGGLRSTDELLSMYLDYDPAALAANPGSYYGQQPEPAPALSKRPPAREPRRYYYKPTGTTFEFRALDP